jgi:hypothetical protein
MLLVYVWLFQPAAIAIVIEAAKGNDVVIESGSETATESSISGTEELNS